MNCPRCRARLDRNFWCKRCQIYACKRCGRDAVDPETCEHCRDLPKGVPTVPYNGRDYYVARKTRLWVFLVPAGERPTSTNILRVSVGAYEAAKRDAKPARGRDERRLRKAHRTGLRTSR